LLMSLQSPVRFHILHAFPFPRRRELKDFLRTLMKMEGTKLESLDYIFCSDEYLLQINREFLEHDYLTDIISFDLCSPGQPVIGEIYISVERVRDNAKEFKQGFWNEMQRVIFHGALHLCGYSDKSATDSKTMRAKENHYIRLFNPS